MEQGPVLPGLQHCSVEFPGERAFCSEEFAKVRHAWARLSQQTLPSLAGAWHRCELRAEHELLLGPLGSDKGWRISLKHSCST